MTPEPLPLNSWGRRTSVLVLSFLFSLIGALLLFAVAPGVMLAFLCSGAFSFTCGVLTHLFLQ